MKKNLFLLLIFLICFCTSEGQAVKIMSYNLRYDNSKDGINRWDERKEALTQLLLTYKPDVLGIQEGLHHQIEHLNASLSDYSYAGVGRDDGKEKGEYCAVFYNKNRYKLKKQSTFWLSPTPDTISVGWDAALERICTFVLLEDKWSKKSFGVFNTHFDHAGKQARIKSAHLVLEKIKELNSDNHPFILMGDFNLKPEEEAIQILVSAMNDTYMQPGSEDVQPQGTFNGFEHNKEATVRIDYIFTSKTDWEQKQFKIIDDQFDERYPSDHLPVFTELLIQN